MGAMGGVGNGGRSKMSGIGSDSSYDPNQGGYGDGFGSVMSSIGSGFGALGAIAGSGMNQASAVLSDQQNLGHISGTVKSTGASFWSSISTAASTVASNITQPDDGDSLGDLQRKMRYERESRKHNASDSRYKGFGSEKTDKKPGDDFFSFARQNMSPEPLSFRSAPAQSSAPLPQKTRQGMAALSSGGGATKMKIDGTGDDFFSSFGAS